jgi:hypothetical protein
MRVVSLNLTKRFAVLSDDRIVPVTNLFDIVGEETTDEDEAVSFVAGADSEWFGGPLAAFDQVSPD